jgi:hypothetical protein
MSPRPATKVWGVFMFSAYFFSAVGILLLERNIDFGYCMLSVGAWCVE